jgi:hypothetical protein
LLEGPAAIFPPLLAPDVRAYGLNGKQTCRLQTINIMKMIEMLSWCISIISTFGAKALFLKKGARLRKNLKFIRREIQGVFCPRGDKKTPWITTQLMENLILVK